MSRKKWIIGIVGIVLLGALVYGGKYGLDFMYYKKVMPALSIGEIDVKSVKDGVYTGSYDAKIISATVNVTVKGGKISEVKLLKHKFEKGGPAVAVVDQVLQKQSLQVDVVSGATNSSKTILKAIENALK